MHMHGMSHVGNWIDGLSCILPIPSAYNTYHNRQLRAPRHSCVERGENANSIGVAIFRLFNYSVAPECW